MKKYTILLTKRAAKDIKTLSPKLANKLREILEIVIAVVPHSGKKLAGDLQACYSFRLTLKDRIVYSVDDNKKVVFIHRARRHYGD
jgi:mRNA-degrading endonuclease RelE of RelBE toxin-antitoxin system